MKTLIILHGWQSSKERWQKVKEEIEKTNKDIGVVVPDLPGFKPEIKLKRPWNLDDYTEWFKNFSQEREKFFLLGHSFGGRIAVKFTAKYPEKIEKLILCASAGLKHKKNLWQLFISAVAKIFKNFSFLPFYSFFQKIFYHYILRKTDYFEAKGSLKETFKKIIEEDLTPYLSQINGPTLIIWGKRDKITPLKDALLIKEKIKNSTLEILEKAGHTPHLESPKELSEIILKFLK